MPPMDESGRSLQDALETLLRRWPAVAEQSSTESPIFVLAAGWRSGSTFLQRLLMPPALIWGEPYGHACPVQHLAESIHCVTNDWPEPHFFVDESGLEELSTRFVANLYPDIGTLLDAHRAYFERLLAEPASRIGAARWGLKEVRLSADHARYLKLLYPQCKLLFLTRNPYDAYRSWAARRNAGWKWFYQWPDQPLSAKLFGQVWQQATAGFVEQAEELGALLIRYEELKEGQFDQLDDYLGFEVNRQAAEVRPTDGPPPLNEIPAAELSEFQGVVSTTAGELGYEPPASRTSRAAVATQQGRAAPGGSSEDPAGCVILVPIGGALAPDCDKGLLELERRGYTVRRVRGYSAIDQGRNQMATDALADGFDETMWIDSDIGFDPDDVEKLRAHGEPIVCGIYPQKGRRVLACHVMPGTEKLVFGEEGGVTEILYAGTGFLLVRRAAYETIREHLSLPLCNERFGGRPMVPYFQPMSHSDPKGHWYLAEDFAFCQRARQAGFKILADTTIRLLHFGNYGYTWEDAGGELQRFRTFHFHTT